jgi:hypothetical protein
LNPLFGNIKEGCTVIKHPNRSLKIKKQVANLLSHRRVQGKVLNRRLKPRIKFGAGSAATYKMEERKMVEGSDLDKMYQM